MDALEGGDYVLYRSNKVDKLAWSEEGGLMYVHVADSGKNTGQRPREMEVLDEFMDLPDRLETVMEEEMAGINSTSIAISRAEMAGRGVLQKTGATEYMLDAEVPEEGLEEAARRYRFDTGDFSYDFDTSTCLE